jgi:hypothetical protein
VNRHLIVRSSLNFDFNFFKDAADIWIRKFCLLTNSVFILLSS